MKYFSVACFKLTKASLKLIHNLKTSIFFSSPCSLHPPFCFVQVCALMYILAQVYLQQLLTLLPFRYNTIWETRKVNSPCLSRIKIIWSEFQLQCGPLIKQSAPRELRNADSTGQPASERSTTLCKSLTNTIPTQQSHKTLAFCWTDILTVFK